MKKTLFFITGTILLTGCAITEWIVSNAETIETGADTAEAFGPYGALVGLAGTTVVGFAKWWEHKASARDVIAATQKAKDDLDPKAKQILTDAYDKHMPSKVKKYVAAVKKKL
jgi:hypothetical protein